MLTINQVVENAGKFDDDLRDLSTQLYSSLLSLDELDERERTRALDHAVVGMLAVTKDAADFIKDYTEKGRLGM